MIPNHVSPTYIFRDFEKHKYNKQASDSWEKYFEILKKDNKRIYDFLGTNHHLREKQEEKYPNAELP